MELSQVIQRHVATEKSTRLKEKYLVYVFEVNQNANRTEVKRAVEKMFKVNVTKVNTMLMYGKMRKVRLRMGRRSDWKKAYVSVQAGQKIEALEI